MANIAGRMAEVRTRLGLTQKDMAEKLGIPYRTLQDGERGIAKPGAATLAAYADQGVDLNWLVTGVKVVSSPSNQLDDQVSDGTGGFRSSAFDVAIAGIIADHLWVSVDPTSLLDAIKSALEKNRVNPAFRDEYQELVRFRKLESN